MTNLAALQQRPTIPQMIHYHGIGLKHMTTRHHRRCLVKHAAIINRIKCLQPITATDLIILLTVARCGMYRARSSFQRHMIPDQNRRILIQIGMAKQAVIQHATGTASHYLTLGANRCQRTSHQLLRQNQHLTHLEIAVVTSSRNF